jgi:hypothetical protein
MFRPSSLLHETTASGRATRRASSDPACLLPWEASLRVGIVYRGHGDGFDGQGGPGLGVAKRIFCLPRPQRGLPPRDRPPREGLPNTPASGRGCLLAPWRRKASMVPSRVAAWYAAEMAPPFSKSRSWISLSAAMGLPFVGKRGQGWPRTLRGRWKGARSLCQRIGTPNTSNWDFANRSATALK